MIALQVKDGLDSTTWVFEWLAYSEAGYYKVKSFGSRGIADNMCATCTVSMPRAPSIDELHILFAKQFTIHGSRFEKTVEQLLANIAKEQAKNAQR